MASATYSYAWQGIHDESVGKEIDPSQTLDISSEPNVSGTPITMSITLTVAAGNPPRTELDSAMRERGWRPI